MDGKEPKWIWSSSPPHGASTSSPGRRPLPRRLPPHGGRAPATTTTTDDKKDCPKKANLFFSASGRDKTLAAERFSKKSNLKNQILNKSKVEKIQFEKSKVEKSNRKF